PPGINAANSSSQHATLMKRILGTLVFVALAIESILAAAGAPGGGHNLLAADYSTHRIALVAPDGTLTWQQKIGDLHDLQRLPDGNVLFQTSYTHLEEVDPRTDRVVWEYDAARMNGNAGRPVEVHAFQRLADGNTMIAESGPARIIEVARDGKLVQEIKL